MCAVVDGAAVDACVGVVGAAAAAASVIAVYANTSTSSNSSTNIVGRMTAGAAVSAMAATDAGAGARLAAVVHAAVGVNPSTTVATSDDCLAFHRGCGIYDTISSAPVAVSDGSLIAVAAAAASALDRRVA